MPGYGEAVLFLCDDERLAPGCGREHWLSAEAALTEA